MKYDIYGDKDGGFSVYRGGRFLKWAMTKWGARSIIKRDRKWREVHGEDDRVLVEEDV